MKILLADDDKDQLELRRLLLLKKGYQPIAVANVTAALKEAKAQSPHCAVVDLKMPTEAIGLGLIRALRENDAALRIFVLTGGDPKRIDKLPERSLVDAVLIKGSAAELVKKLAELSNGAEPKLSSLRATLAKNRVVTFAVKVVLRSSRSEVVGITADGAMKVRVAAVPDKGKANEELRDVLAGWFKVPKNNVELLQGETSQRKVWRVRK